MVHFALSQQFFKKVLLWSSAQSLLGGLSVVKMSVFSQECDQREQCAQPVDTNGPPHYQSCVALDHRDPGDHCQQGSVTLDGRLASERCPAQLPGHSVCPRAETYTLTSDVTIESYRLSYLGASNCVKCTTEKQRTPFKIRFIDNTAVEVNVSSGCVCTSDEH